MHPSSSVPEITPSELKGRIDAGDGVALLDVREPFEAQIADLPENGQDRIPLGELMDRYAELDSGNEIVVYCRSGGRSERAAAFLLQNGFERVHNLKGGVLCWRAEVDPSLTAY